MPGAPPLTGGPSGAPDPIGLPVGGGGCCWKPGGRGPPDGGGAPMGGAPMPIPPGGGPPAAGRPTPGCIIPIGGAPGGPPCPGGRIVLPGGGGAPARHARGVGPSRGREDRVSDAIDEKRAAASPGDPRRRWQIFDDFPLSLAAKKRRNVQKKTRRHTNRPSSCARGRRPDPTRQPLRRAREATSHAAPRHPRPSHGIERAPVPRHDPRNTRRLPLSDPSTDRSVHPRSTASCACTARPKHTGQDKI